MNRSALKVEENRDKHIKKILKKGKDVTINEVKVSFNKIKKKKKPVQE